MRPTNFCHLLENCDCPYLVRSWLAPRFSPRGRPTESWAPCDLPRDRVLHGTRERFGGSQLDTRCLASTISRVSRRGSSRAWVFCPHGAHCDRASDISVASPSSRGNHRCAFALPLLAPRHALASCGALSVGGSRQGRRDHLLVKGDGS